MKLLPILLSIVVLFYLGVDFIGSISSAKQNHSTASELAFTQPKRVGNELLDVEKAWLAIKEQQKQASQPKSELVNISENQKILTLGDKNYILYGIFNDPKSPFILLKEEGATMIKLAKGDKLSADATLITLESNKIAFDKNNQIIEFKLFERKK
jgi:hypothetical protein